MHATLTEENTVPLPNFLRFYGGDKRRFVIRLRALGRE